MAPETAMAATAAAAAGAACNVDEDVVVVVCLLMLLLCLILLCSNIKLCLPAEDDEEKPSAGVPLRQRANTTKNGHQLIR
jgi:hypothetical protein